MYKRGLFPLVKKLQIRDKVHVNKCTFSQKQFNCRTLRHFWALSHVQELGIENLDIPSFMPRIRRYFKHFLPTVHSLALREPKGSNRQVTYFIGLFPHLQDLKLLYDVHDPQDEQVDNTTPIPPFAPPLRGRLTVVGLKKVGLLKEMIDLFGGIQFRHMDIYNVTVMRPLLHACAKTLETLRLYPNDPRGERLSLKHTQVLDNNSAAALHLQDFDLSQNVTLRTLEVRAWYIYGTGPLAHALSTITSPAFSKVTVTHWYSDIYRPLPVGATEAHHWRFEVFRTMRKVRDFQLVLRADVPDHLGECSVRKLKEIMAAEKAKIGCDDTFPEPLVFYSPPEPYCRFDRDPLFAL